MRQTFGIDSDLQVPGFSKPGEHVPEIATEYSRRVGTLPDIFEGTSPGAIEFGIRRYRFGAAGWGPVED